MATKRYHIIKAVFKSPAAPFWNITYVHLYSFYWAEGVVLSGLCALSVWICVYNILSLTLLRSLGIKFLSFCFHLICLRHYLILYTCPNHQDILEIKFNIITHYVHAKYVPYVHRVHTFRELHFGYSLLTYLVILCI